MASVTVHASQTYTVEIENGLIDRIGERSASLLPGRAAALITEETVDALYGERVQTSLEKAGFSVQKLVLPAGEQTKCMECLETVLEFLAEQRMTRKDAVFALGGGVIGDLAGFASAVYLRGVRYVQIPTTLLAAVDSSVGGKTAVDLKAGKNLAGAFHQPVAVFCDPQTLRTLPKETFADGCAEVIKYAILAGDPLKTLLSDPEKADWEAIITECVTIKKNYVEEDEFDTGARMFLNLGHTVGHAIEKASDLSITHGSAVAIGTVIAARIALGFGLCDASLPNEIEAMEKAYHLPTVSPFRANELVGSMTKDKKRFGQTIRLILPKTVGECVIREVDVTSLQGILEQALQP